MTIFKKLLKFYKDLSIKKKLLLILYIQIIIPLIFIGYMSYKNSEEIIQKKSIAYSQDILRMIELRLKDYSNNLAVISQDLLSDGNIFDILNSEESNIDPLNSYENENKISNILKKVILSRNEIQSICIVSNRLKYYFKDNNSSKTSIVDTLPYPKVLAKARLGYGQVVWVLDSKNRKVENIFLARMIYNRDTYKEMGLLAIQVKKEFFEAVYQDLVTEDMKNIAVISSENEVIVSRNPNNVYLLNKDLQKSVPGKNGPIVDKASGTLISYVNMNQPNWIVVTYISLRQLFKEIDLLRQRIIMLSIISVLILTILSVYIAVDFINPINKLVKGMEKVQKGASDVRVEVDREDELGFLNRTFNKMVKEINNLVTWIYREQITRKEAELKALQSQINPHFLFNTLESINWMAQLNNVPEISETVSDLSSLMEASIGRDDRLITVEEEFTYTDKYISLLKRRFEDRLELVKNLQDSALKVRIPRLLIQPLIENAVYHGVEKCRGKGIINLNAFIDKDSLVIEVIDNGPGIESDELEMLNEKLAMDNDTYFKTLGSKKNKSIGIENVNRRIKLFYGESYGLKIESETGKYTKIDVTIPLQQETTGEGYYVSVSE